MSPIAAIRVAACCSLLLALGCAQSAGGPTSRATVIDQKQVLVDAIADESQFVSISVDNSVVEIHTNAVDRVVKQGPAIIPALLKKMRMPGINFDTFIRCYSAAEQIAEKQGLQDQIYWTGGATSPDFEELVSEHGTTSQKIGPGGQTFDDAFRKRVIDSIEKCFAENKNPAP